MRLENLLNCAPGAQTRYGDLVLQLSLLIKAAGVAGKACEEGLALKERATTELELSQDTMFRRDNPHSKRSEIVEIKSALEGRTIQLYCSNPHELGLRHGIL